MKKIFDIFRAHWRAIVWTILYVTVIWAVMRGLFGFDIFSHAHWARIGHIHLHGFPGMVFGLLILAAVPLYVATTTLVIRNKELPIKIPCPNCFTPPPAPQPEPKPQVDTPIVTERETLPILPHGVPQEMRETFMRARTNAGVRQMSVFNKAPFADAAPTTQPPGSAPSAVRAPTPEQATNFKPVFEAVPGPMDTDSGLPIPEDFDIETEPDIPVFSDITFDDAEPDDTPQPQTDEKSDLLEFLTNAGIAATEKDDLIFANGFAIASHTDQDFWVADELDWFGAGKQKPSPIAALLQEKSKPVLYLGATNIMNFDTLSADWRAAGITIITDRDELLKLLQE